MTPVKLSTGVVFFFFQTEKVPKNQDEGKKTGKKIKNTWHIVVLFWRQTLTCLNKLFCMCFLLACFFLICQLSTGVAPLTRQAAWDLLQCQLLWNHHLDTCQEKTEKFEAFGVEDDSGQISSRPKTRPFGPPNGGEK